MTVHRDFGLALSGASSIGHLQSTRALPRHELGWTFISGALAAWLTDEVGEDQAAGLFVRGSQVRMAGGLVGLLAGAALASIRLNLPIVLGGVLMIALSVFLLATMTEHGFHPRRREHGGWRTMRSTLRGAMISVRRSPSLLAIIGLAAVYGGFSEGVDRLWEAHFLRDLTLPRLAGLQPVSWFGVISAGGSLVSFAALEIVRKRLDLTREGRAERSLLMLTVALIIAVVAFGLAGTFIIGVAAFWLVTLLRSVIGPIMTVWTNRHVEGPFRATVFSLAGQADAAGQFAGGPLIGAAGTIWSLRAAMAGAAVLLSPGLALYLWVIRRGGKT